MSSDRLEGMRDRRDPPLSNDQHVSLVPYLHGHKLSSGKLSLHEIMTRSGKFVINHVDRDAASSAEGVASTTTTTATVNATRLTITQKLEYVLAVLNRLLIGFVTIYMCWMCLRLQWHEIPWHALLCTLGVRPIAEFVCLMSEGLIAHYRGNAWTQLCYRTEKTRTHWILQLCGSVLGLAGIFVKINLEDVHFHTVHGQIGLATFILCLLSLLSGASSLYANELRVRLQPLLNKALHNILGLSTFITAMASMVYSFETAIFMDYSLDAATSMDFRLLLQIMVVVIMVLSSYGPVWCLIYSKLWECC